MGEHRTRVGSGEELYTVDELAAATGMTVRTTRYYAGLGLLPPRRRDVAGWPTTPSSTVPDST